jgi:uncharacterized protein (TIGR02145 family)
MKQLIPLIFSLAILGLFLIGCESIGDPEPVSDSLFSTNGISGVGTLSGGITKEMCKVDPGWKALGFRNLGQCVRYVETGKDSRPPDNSITVIDIDGNVYQTVTIGNQVWMAENLRVTYYRNGNAIPTGLSNADWQNKDDGAYAIYPHSQIDGLNSDAEVAALYGNLYNWYAVTDPRGLCPTGWHVPSDGEWTTLTDYLGGSSIAGGKMKSTRTEPDPHPRWDDPNTGATNESGFSGLPGSERGGIGGYLVIGGYVSWWSSTEDGTADAWRRDLSYNSGVVGRSGSNKHWGYSVRCLRD